MSNQFTERNLRHERAQQQGECIKGDAGAGISCGGASTNCFSICAGRFPAHRGSSGLLIHCSVPGRLNVSQHTGLAPFWAVAAAGVASFRMFRITSLSSRLLLQCRSRPAPPGLLKGWSSRGWRMTHKHRCWLAHGHPGARLSTAFGPPNTARSLLTTEPG